MAQRTSKAALAAGARYPVRLEMVSGRVLCVGCREPYDPGKRWQYAGAY